jgi:hypothetical protein
MASVVPLRHDEYPRFVQGAWPFYTGWSPVVKQELEDAMTLGALERNIVFRREAIRGNGSLVHRSANMWVEHRELELNIIRRERLP